MSAAELADLLRAARDAADLTQEEVGDKLGSNSQRVSLLETGSRLPQLDELTRLHRKLVAGTDADLRAGTMLTWLAAWIEAHRSKREDSFSREDGAELDAALALLRRVLPVAPGDRRSGVRSLQDFPRAFLPLQIILGDRRELSERDADRADLFALSVATSDIMFLSEMLLKQAAFWSSPPAMWSDKTLLRVSDDPEYIQTHFGNSNLLVIGSPAVNWVARMINRRAIFRFDIDRVWQQWDESYRTQPALADSRSRTFKLFWKIVRDVEESADLADHDTMLACVARDEDLDEDERDAFESAYVAATEVLVQDGAVVRPSAIIPQFRKHGLLDPVDVAVHGLYTRPNNDFGVISLAPNPFAAPDSDYVAVLCGGIHGPGTAVGVRVLGSPERFVDHPFGGVLEVHLPTADVTWPNRMRLAKPRWQTAKYEPHELAGKLDAAVGLKQRSGPGTGGWLGSYTEAELAELRDFVLRLCDRDP